MWKERNLRIFGESSISIAKLQDYLLILGWWITGWCEDFTYSPTAFKGTQHVLCRMAKLLPRVSYPCPLLICYGNPLTSIALSGMLMHPYVNISSSCSTIGGVLQNHKGNFMCLFSSPISFMEINCAEVLAIHMAIVISLANEALKERKIILESDSSNVVLWCNCKSGGPWNMNFHLSFIRNACNRSLSIEIIHRSRNSNFVANTLAKQGLHC